MIVLTNPYTRKIYDDFGEYGLALFDPQVWNVIHPFGPYAHQIERIAEKHVHDKNPCANLVHLTTTNYIQ